MVNDIWYYTGGGSIMTLTDIAKQLNLSVPTVSKALNGSMEIAEETKKRVCEYAQSVGYQSRKSVAIIGRIAILWGRQPRAGEPLSEIAQAFRDQAQAMRYVVESDIMDVGFDLNDYLASNHFLGALLLDINYRSPIYSQLTGTKYPIVLVDNYIVGHPLISAVGSDNIHAVEEAVDYLVKLGHGRIAFLGGELQSRVGTERLAGYILGLAKNGIEYRHDITYFGDYSLRSGEEAADYYLDGEKNFTAIICASDLMAHGFIRRISRAGKRIPEDISVIGYDDIPIDPDIQLTTIRQDFERTGVLGFQALEMLIRGLPSQRAMVGYKLISRGTTAEPSSAQTAE